MTRIIIEDDVCEECKCGKTVHEGDAVEFINYGSYSPDCDVCPCCRDEVDAAASRAGEVKEGYHVC